MIEFERTFDYELVRQIVTHPKIYRFVTDDFSPPPEGYRPPENDGIWYVLVKDNEELLGMFMFMPHNTVCWEIHTCILPQAWGAVAVAAVLGISHWIWKNTPCRRIITAVPEQNRLALRLAEKAGMNCYGMNAASVMKGGKLRNQIMLGLSPECI